MILTNFLPPLVRKRRGFRIKLRLWFVAFSTEEGDGEGGGGGDFVGRRSILTTHCHYWDENDDDMVARVERGGSTDSASSREDTVSFFFFFGIFCINIVQKKNWKNKKIYQTTTFSKNLKHFLFNLESKWGSLSIAIILEVDQKLFFNF